MAARPTIVLTGFGPFPGVEVNASAKLVTDLAVAVRVQFPDYDVIGEILPTEWIAAPRRMLQLLDGINPALVLHFGVSQHAQGFELELIGRNMRTSLQDAAGELPPTVEVIPEGPALLAATLPAERIVVRLSRLGLPCQTSDNAGTYLCNTMLYHSLATARTRPPPYPVGFIHVPARLIGADPPSNFVAPDCLLGWDAAYTGALEIVAACLDPHEEPRR
jgi:pyroglutamyl-peptidase